MNRFILSGILGLLLISSVAQANEFTEGLSGNVGVVTRDIYRGVQTNDNISVFADGRYTYNGFFADASVNTLNDNDYRSHIGGGWGADFGEWDVEFSYRRMFWDEAYSDDYNEFTAKGSYTLYETLAFYGELSYQPNIVSGLDTTYGLIGANYFIDDKWTVGLSVSGIHYDSNVYDNTTYNNTAVNASYELFDNFDITAMYSWGGDLPLNQGILHNASNIGVRYRF